jgi:hybrid cluster-associated redox disulfide protein
MPMIEPKQISQSWTVSQILQMYPETSRVFLQRKTFCVGCYMARFCNLSDVAKVYSLEVEILVHDIQQATIKNAE